MAQSELKDVIQFPENTGPLGSFDDPVVILDPVQSDNNVAARVTESERLQIVNAAAEAWETAQFRVRRERQRQFGRNSSDLTSRSAD